MSAPDIHEDPLEIAKERLAHHLGRFYHVVKQHEREDELSGLFREIFDAYEYAMIDRNIQQYLDRQMAQLTKDILGPSAITPFFDGNVAIPNQVWAKEPKGDQE